MSTEITYITPTPAVAREIKEFLALSHREAGDQVWEIPHVYPVDSWARTLWLQTWPVEQQLHPVGELALCEQVLATAMQEAEEPRTVLAHTEYARSAQHALGIESRWRIDVTKNVFVEEHRHLQELGQRLEARLREIDAITSAQVEDKAAHAIEDGLITPPRNIVVVGDDDLFTPAARDLLKACERNGSVVAKDDPRPSKVATSVRSIISETESNMWKCVAHAARSHLESHPNHRILVLVDNEESSQGAIDRAFREVFLPGATARTRSRTPWRFQSGRRLAHYAAVNAALMLMRFVVDNKSPKAASEFLLNPVLFEGKDRGVAALLERRLRSQGGDQVGISRIVNAGERYFPGSRVTRKLHELDAALRERPATALPSEWVSFLDQVLTIFTWPNVEGSKPAELLQELEQWRDGCAVLQSLDSILGRVDAGVAGKYLREIMATRRFTPRSEVGEPIEIASYEDGQGLRADFKIVAGLNDSNFPRPVVRNAFIAQELLVEAGVPYTTPADSHRRGLHFVESLRNTASEVLLAFAKATDSGAELGIPPIMKPLLSAPSEEVVRETEWVRLSKASEVFVEREDPVPLTAFEASNRQKGGTSVLKDTAMSPLVGFVRHRLGVESVAPWVRISASTQGTITHRVLARLLKTWDSRDALAEAMADVASATSAIEGAVDEEMRRCMPAEYYSASTVTLERARQIQTITDYLRHEIRRTHNFKVLAREMDTGEIDFYGLRLSLQIDRIDVVDSEMGPRYLFIDYKTGDAKPGGWDASELREPQLPMYSSEQALAALHERLVEEQVDVPGRLGCDGICFSIVTRSIPAKSKGPALRTWTNFTLGLIQESRSRTNRLVDSWDKQRGEWQERLSSIVGLYLSGDLRHPDLPAKDTRFISDLISAIKIVERGYVLEEGNDE